MRLKTYHKMLIARCLRWPIVTFRELLNLKGPVNVRRNGIDWSLDLDEGIDLAIYLFGCFEQSTTFALKRLVKPGNTVLDIGANIGSHTLPLAGLVGPTGKVVAFEPTSYAYDKAYENLRLNPQLSRSVILEQIMLTTEASESLPPFLYSSWPLIKVDCIHTKLCGASKITQGAKVMSLDSYLETAGITKIDLIKLDVDGYECKILHGAKKTLTKSKPIIVIELCPYLLKEIGDSLEELLKILQTTGYRLYEETSEKEIPLDARQLDETIEEGSGFNAIAKYMG